MPTRSRAKAHQSSKPLSRRPAGLRTWRLFGDGAAAGAIHSRAVAGDPSRGASTNLHPQMSPIQTIATVMRNRFAQMSAWQPFSSIAIIFEASERADRLIDRAFGELQVSIDGNPVPIECFFIPKSAAEPTWEVADFVVHAIGGQARANLLVQAPPRRDFRSVFDIPDQRLASFMSIASVTVNSPTAQAAPT
jgi:hypothetical protein